MSEIVLSPESRLLGKSGLRVSPIAWGMWRFAGDDVNAARARVEAALDAGITLFDTADIYGPDNGEPFGAAEVLLGRVFREAPDLRHKMVLATKGGIVIGTPYDSSPDYLEAAIDASLTRLGIERVELWQIHRPDILSHPLEVARTLEKARALGKIGSVGVSNFTIAQTKALASFLDHPLATIQPELSPVALAPIEDGSLDMAMADDLGVLAWSPLGQGRIAHPVTERELAVAEALQSVASDFGVSRAAAAYSWVMAHPSRPIPIVGTQQPARIAEAADAFKVTWTRARWYEVLVAARGEALP